MLFDLLRNNPVIHFFTNTFLLLNFYYKRGKNNIISGRLKGLFIKTSFTVKGNNNRIVVAKGVKASNCRIYISGSDNSIFIDENCSLDDTVIWISGDGNNFNIGKDSWINNAEIGLQYSENSIIAKANTYIGGYLQLGRKKSKTETIYMFAFEGSKIVLDNNTYISDGVVMRTSDSHSIYDSAGTRINKADDISVGRGSWVCSGASLLKGAKIGTNSIVGFKSLVTKDFSSENNVIIAGMPGRIVRRDISWGLEI